MSYYLLSTRSAAGCAAGCGQLPTLPATVPGCDPCAVGYLGCRPYCAVDPHYGSVPTMPGIPSTTPAPTVTPPADPAAVCAAAGGTWDEAARRCFFPQAPKQCPSGQTWAPGANQCVPFPGGVEPEPTPTPTPTPTPAAAEAGSWSQWWAERTGMETALILGGVGLVAVVLIDRIAR